MEYTNLSIIAAAWVQVLGQRRDEEGYSDKAVANEAAILAIETWRAIQFHNANTEATP